MAGALVAEKQDVVGLVAAMEPAAERREHGVGVNAANNDAIRPQWSPPSDGGSTRLLEVPGGAGVVAAMEPAAERREHCARRTS